jgi:putative NADH-flavin reductase
MKLLVLGPTGGLGKHVVAQSVELGHHVTVLARDPAKVSAQHEHLKCVKGSVLRVSDVEAALDGQDAVISALGVGSARRSFNLIEGAMAVIVNAMQRKGVRRLIFTSGITLKLAQVPLPLRLLLRLMLWDQIRDKKAGEDILRDSEIDWTLVYPTMLTDGPRTGQYRVGEHLELSGFPKVSRADVADLILKLLADGESVHRDLVVSG